jgi:hypothetical protein
MLNVRVHTAVTVTMVHMFVISSSRIPCIRGFKFLFYGTALQYCIVAVLQSDNLVYTITVQLHYYSTYYGRVLNIHHVLYRLQC